eukprot:2779999-Amphidinium_carterae.1
MGTSANQVARRFPHKCEQWPRANCDHKFIIHKPCHLIVRKLLIARAIDNNSSRTTIPTTTMTKQWGQPPVTRQPFCLKNQLNNALAQQNNTSIGARQT